MFKKLTFMTLGAMLFLNGGQALSFENHHHDAPHGGQMISVKPNFHYEIVTQFKNKSNLILIYVTQNNMTPIPLKNMGAKTITLIISRKKNPGLDKDFTIPIKLKPDSKNSYLLGKLNLDYDMTKIDYTMIIQLMIDGKIRSGKFNHSLKKKNTHHDNNKERERMQYEREQNAREQNKNKSNNDGHSHSH